VLEFRGRKGAPFICGRAYWATWATGSRAGTWAASCQAISCRAGPTLWAEAAAQHSPLRARAGPGPKISCWARTCVGPKFRALGRPMGLVLCGHLYSAVDRERI
jgi:hypothetical protein